MITWLTPTIRPCRAAGTSTRQVSCRRVQPLMRANSRISSETPRRATMVTRAIGGMA